MASFYLPGLSPVEYELGVRSPRSAYKALLRDNNLLIRPYFGSCKGWIPLNSEHKSRTTVDFLRPVFVWWEVGGIQLNTSEYVKLCEDSRFLSGLSMTTFYFQMVCVMEKLQTIPPYLCTTGLVPDKPRGERKFQSFWDHQLGTLKRPAIQLPPKKMGHFPMFSRYRK